MNSTAISSQDSTIRPDPNLSSIPSHMSCSVLTEPANASAVACDLCGQLVKGRAYLAQHKNKKKCLEKQRIQKEAQQSLEASVARMGSLRVSESDSSTSSSKVIKTIMACFLQMLINCFI